MLLQLSIVNLAILISILITFLQFFLSVMVSNTSLKAGRSILKSSHISLFPSLIKEKKFIDTVENLTVFVEKKNRNGVMNNVFLRDDTAKFDQSRTIIAKKGYIVKKDEENILVLYNGTIQSEKKNNKINFLNFERTEINLSSFSTKTTTFPKIQERGTLTLLNCIKPFLKEHQTTLKQSHCRARKDDIAAEVNRRLGMPLYIPFI